MNATHLLLFYLLSGTPSTRQFAAPSLHCTRAAALLSLPKRTAAFGANARMKSCATMSSSHGFHLPTSTTFSFTSISRRWSDRMGLAWVRASERVAVQRQSSSRPLDHPRRSGEETMSITREPALRVQTCIDPSSFYY